MDRTCCFVTYELSPGTPGGAGVVIAGLAEALARSGAKVHVIADMPDADLDRYREHLRRASLPTLKLHPIATLTEAPPAAGTTIFMAKSLAFRDAVYALGRREELDVVEFFDYAGAGFSTLALRQQDDALERTAVVVRIHGTLGSIDLACGVCDPDLERLSMYQQERWAMALADAVLTPVEGVGHQYRDWYGFGSDRLRHAPPPMEHMLAALGAAPSRDERADQVLYWGKLHPVKGCDTFVEAAVALLESRPGLRFTLVGADTSEPPGGSVRRQLERAIPEARRGSFQFLPQQPRERMRELVAQSVCAVVPSRSESFCLVAHELGRLGCPVVVGDLPAFRGFRDGDDCVRFDGTAGGLAVAIDALARDAALRERVSAAGRARRYGDPIEVYGNLQPAGDVDPGLRRWATMEAESLARRAGVQGDLGRDLDAIVGSKAWRTVTAARRLRDVLLRRP